MGQPARFRNVQSGRTVARVAVHRHLNGPFGEFDGCIGGWELEGEPFTTGRRHGVQWWRARMVGGRTNHWGRISLRFGPDDFKAKSRDGLGDDWPIGYEDVKPYYDRVDKLIGVFGNNDNCRTIPADISCPPPKPRCYELMIKDAADRSTSPASRRDSRFSPRPTTAAWPATTAASAIAAAEPTRTSRRRTF